MPIRRKYTKAQKAAYAKRMRNKKKTQRSAYKPRNKNAMKMRRQPFVETKKATTLVVQDQIANPIVVPSDASAPQYRQWTNVNMSPTTNFLFLARGNGYSNMIGRDIYSKYLQQKIEIELPAGNPPDTTNPGSTPNANRATHRITQPVQFWVVWGWIKQPIGHEDNESGSPISTAMVREQIDYITEGGNRLLGNIHTRNTRDSDFLTFKDRRKNIWTMKKKLLKISSTPSSVKVPDSHISQEFFQTDFQNPPEDPPNPGAGPRFNKADWGDFNANAGYPNKLQTTIEWTTNRKMRFYPDDSGTGGFARDSWLPFSYLCVPKQFQDGCNRASPALYTYGETVDMKSYYDLVGDIKINASMCHWFSDS
tara:strand:+ start:344 stop:1441 length:1098 start_codon:yes stop_codon:yes gene_type:complete